MNSWVKQSVMTEIRLMRLPQMIGSCFQESGLEMTKKKKKIIIHTVQLYIVFFLLLILNSCVGVFLLTFLFPNRKKLPGLNRS